MPPGLQDKLQHLDLSVLLLGVGAGLFAAGLLLLIGRLFRKKPVAPPMAKIPVAKPRAVARDRSPDLEEAGLAELEGSDADLQIDLDKAFENAGTADLKIRMVIENAASQPTARLKITNVGFEPIHLVSWFVQWGRLNDDDAQLLLQTHESFPVYLDANDTHEMTVSIDQGPVGRLQKLGVIDREKRRFMATLTTDLG